MSEQNYIYVAFRSVPDYNSQGPWFHSAHMTLIGAIKALYPDQVQFQTAFRKQGENEWIGPDGFGLVKQVELYT